MSFSGFSAAGDIGRANQWLVGDVFLKSVYFATEVDRCVFDLFEPNWYLYISLAEVCFSIAILLVLGRGSRPGICFMFFLSAFVYSHRS